MVSGWRRSQMLAALLAVLLTLVSLAAAQPSLRVNGREDKDLNRNVVRRNGNVMAPARPLFRQFGSDIERKGDWYSSRHGGHEYRFKPGSRVWYEDNRALYFREAPYEHNGSLLLNVLDLVGVLGGRFDWDDRYQRGNIYYPQTPAGYGPGSYYPGGYAPGGAYNRPPVPLQVQFPKNYARVNNRGMNVSGYAIPYGDVEVAVYRLTSRGSQLVFDSRARVNSAGTWALRAPLYGTGTYQMRVRSLDDYGRVVGEKILTLYAD
jgi:hypothetical protein